MFVCDTHDKIDGMMDRGLPSLWQSGVFIVVTGQHTQYRRC